MSIKHDIQRYLLIYAELKESCNLPTAGSDDELLCRHASLMVLTKRQVTSNSIPTFPDLMPHTVARTPHLIGDLSSITRNPPEGSGHQAGRNF